jgi:hypothetical protein
MKKLLLLSLILLGCAKKETKPVQQTSTTQTGGKVFCWYKVDFGVNAFYKCTSTQEEYNQTSAYCATNQWNMVVTEKNNCNECQ